MKRQIIAGILILAALAGLGCWWNRYTYFKLGSGEGVQFEYRTNRFTNETDALGRNGWRVIQTSKQWDWYKYQPVNPEHN